MLKVGFIGASVGFIYVTTFNLFSPFCTLCITPFLGVGVGYFTGWVDRPVKAQATVGRAVIAGGITSFAVLLGQIIATATNAIIVTNLENWSTTLQEFGFSPVAISNYDYWQATIITNTVCGLFNILLIVSLSVFGSLIWFRQHNHQ